MSKPSPCFVFDLLKAVQRIAPPALAEPWDNVDLQIGDPLATLKKVLVALEITAPVIEEAKALGVNAIVTHHPLVFKPWSALNLAQPGPALAAQLIKADIALIAAHSNLDAAQWSTNHALADRMGWKIDEPLLPRTGEAEKLYKFLVFVPLGHEQAIIEAIDRGGGGQIGAYSHCTFRSQGTGTFKGEAGSDPYIGEAGKLESAEEFRLEAIVPASRREAVYREVRAAHPYETVACDWIEVAALDQPVGLGGIVKLEEATRPNDLAGALRERISASVVRIAGPEQKKIKRIAICTGSGGSFIGKAASRADAFVTGEITYHQAVEAHQRGIAVLEVGHFESEVIVCEPLAQRLAQADKLREAGVEVIAARRDLQPFRYA